MERSGSALFVDMGTSKRAFTRHQVLPHLQTGGKTEAVRGEIAAQGHTASQRWDSGTSPAQKMFNKHGGAGAGGVQPKGIQGKGMG